MTKREQASLRAIKNALQRHDITQEERLGLIDALETLRDCYANREIEQTIATEIGTLYKPHFGTDQTPEQEAHNAAIRAAQAIAKRRTEERR